MDPSVYIPAYLERAYVASHPELTDAARELVHNDISANPHKYAQTEHAQALLSYAGVHRHLLDELHRIEDMGSDEEFEQTRNRLFDDMRDELLNFSGMFLHPRLPVFPAHLFRRKHTVTHKGKIAAGKEAGFVRPVLHEIPFAERLIQPVRGIVAQAAEQHQVRATGNNVNGVDLKQRHALNGRENIGRLRAAAGLFKQPLRGKVKITCS